MILPSLNAFFLLYVTKFVDLRNGRGLSSILLSLRRKGGSDDRAEADEDLEGVRITSDCGWLMEIQNIDRDLGRLA